MREEEMDMKDLKGRDLKGIADFTAEEIERTLEVSRLLKCLFLTVI